MISYAEIASKIQLPINKTHKARDSKESLGQIRRSPPRRVHLKSLPQMENSELLTSEPTPSFDSLTEELGMGPLEIIEDESEAAAILSDDEAAAILNGGKTRDFPGTPNQGTTKLPRNSQVIIDHDITGSEVIELPRNQGDSTPSELPMSQPRDTNNFPDSPHREWEVINKRNRSHKTSTPKTPQNSAEFEDPFRESSNQKK